jgi:hypothetical protein
MLDPPEPGCEETEIMPDRQLMKSPSPPRKRPHTNTEDHRAEFVAISAKTPVDEEFRTAFLRNKLLIARTHPKLNIAARNQAVAGLIDRLGKEAAESVAEPRPGGVGEGFFYTTDFKTNWGLGTSLSCDFVCPVPAGGNVSTWLYLTATNRSGLGVEAFVAYNGQDTPYFRVYDWARSDPWQTDIPFTSLDNYVTTMSAHGTQYPVLPVWNSTWAIDTVTYRNEALLYNNVRGSWDLVYQCDYATTDSQQKTGWPGSWAPIVETFQPLYANTNPMGALDTQLIGSDDNGVWGDWATLSFSDSYVRTDNVGFNLVFLDANYAFVVNS